jgi:hypothetical protein
VDSRFASAHKLHRAKTATTEAVISCATKTGQLEKLQTVCLPACPLWLPVLHDLMAFMKESISPIRRMIARLRHM